MWKTIFTIDTWHKDYHKTVDQIRTKWSTVFLCSHLHGIITVDTLVSELSVHEIKRGNRCNLHPTRE